MHVWEGKSQEREEQLRQRAQVCRSTRRGRTPEPAAQSEHLRGWAGSQVSELGTQQVRRGSLQGTRNRGDREATHGRELRSGGRQGRGAERMGQYRKPPGGEAARQTPRQT